MSSIRAARYRRCRNRHGLSIVEVLISLAIVSTLLTAVAVAFQASFNSIETNDRFFRATHTARVAMNRILQTARTADACIVGTEAQQSLASVSATTLDVIDINGSLVRYVFNVDDRTITATSLDVTGSPSRIVARDVEQATFTSTVELGAVSGLRRTTCVAVDLVIAVENESLYLSGSVVPRRSLED